MKAIQTKLETAAFFSDDGTRRYLLKKFWDGKKPALTIIMLAPGEASGIALDNTTQLVLNNAVRLGYGSVSIVNLFAVLNDTALACVEEKDEDNLSVIIEEVKRSDTVVYAPGVGKAKNPIFQNRAAQVLEALKPYSGKLKCISNADNTVRLLHPLTPVVRTWYLRDVTIEEALQAAPKEAKKEKRPVGRPKKTMGEKH